MLGEMVTHIYCVRGRSSDSGEKKRTTRLAKTNCRWLCLRELGLFVLVLACGSALPSAVRSAHKDSRWRWIDSITGWQWVLFEAFALLLAIVAATGLFFGAKLWR